MSKDNGRPGVRPTDAMVHHAMLRATREQYTPRFDNGRLPDHVKRTTGFLGEYCLAEALGYPWEEVHERSAFDASLVGLSDLHFDGRSIEVKTQNNNNTMIRAVWHGQRTYGRKNRVLTVLVAEEQLKTIKESEILVFGIINEQLTGWVGCGWIEVETAIREFEFSNRSVFNPPTRFPNRVMEIPIERLHGLTTKNDVVI